MLKKNRGFILILSSPSGCGKTTIAKSLLVEDKNLILSVSATTRKPREGEIEGKDYFFLDNQQFEKYIKQNYFLECARVFNRYYGTPKSFVFKKLNVGQNVLFDIDWQGVVQLKQKVSSDMVTIFILPPSMKELKKRLINRNSDHPEEIEKRIQEARFEITKATEYDYILINDNLDEAVITIKSIIIAETCKRNSKKFLEDFQKQHQ